MGTIYKHCIDRLLPEAQLRDMAYVARAIAENPANQVADTAAVQALPEARLRRARQALGSLQQSSALQQASASAAPQGALIAAAASPEVREAVRKQLDTAGLPALDQLGPESVGMSLPIFMALLTGKLWQPGRTLRVALLDGTPTAHAKVQSYAEEWTRHANLRFEFYAPSADAEIRITLRPGGSWSYIGTDALSVSKSEPTMQLGWVNEWTSDDQIARVVIHEFGHALGCIHEHQSPSGSIPWDREAVYAAYAGAPNLWSREMVDRNIFQTYDHNLLRYSEFDRASVMLYPVPNELTIGDYEVGWNSALSETDRRFISEVYPSNGVTDGGEAGSVVGRSLVAGGEWLAAAIGQANEVQEFALAVAEAGSYVIETRGTTDTVMKLFAEGRGESIAEHDDISKIHPVNRNARVSKELGAGSYRVCVYGYKQTTGAFEIRARRAP